MKRTLGLFGTLVALVAAAYALLASGGLRRTATAKTEADASPAARATAAKAAPVAPRSRQRVHRVAVRANPPGNAARRAARYALTYDSRTTGSDATALARVHLAGTWELAEVAHEEELTHVACRLDVHGSGAGLGASLDPSETAYLTLDAQGRVVAVHVPASWNPQAEGLLRALASAWQVVRPQRASESWSVVEPGPLGDVKAHYEAHGDTFSREIAGRDAPRTDGGVVLATVSTRGRAAVRVAPDGWPARVEARQEVRVDPHGAPTLVTETRVVLERAASGDEVALQGDFFAALPHLRSRAASEPLFAPADSRQMDAARAQGVTVASATAAIARAWTRHDAATARQARQRLVALLRTEPQHAEEVAEVLRDGHVDSKTANTLISALGSAHTPEASRTLAELIDGEGSSAAVRQNATITAGMHALPMPEVRGALRRAASSADEDLANTATLALGNLAARDPQHGGDIATDLLERYENAADDGQRLLLLGALGNAGDPRVLPLAVEALADANPAIRAAAVRALRFVPDPQADALVAATMREDAEAIVRRAAVFAAAFRPLEMQWDALVAVLLGDPAAPVRSEAVALVGRRLLGFPQAAPVLEQVAANDPSAEVRAAAKARLDTWHEQLADAAPGEQP